MAFQIKDDVDDQSGIAQLIKEHDIKALLKDHLTEATNALRELVAPQSLASVLHLTFATATSFSATSSLVSI